MTGDPHDIAALVRARLLASLNHELRAPLARIAQRAHSGWVDLPDLEIEARRQLEWLADLQECARFELRGPELAVAPAYLHTLMQRVTHDPAELPGLALVDAYRLSQVLGRLREQTGGPLILQARMAGDSVRLHFQIGVVDGPWRDVSATLGDERIMPGMVLARHLVQAMGGRLQHSGEALRFEIAAPLADERDAIPPAPRFDWPEPFGANCAILLLEPHQAMQDYVSEILESAEFDVQYEPDGREPDLILCADESVWDIWPPEEAPPVLLHALVPPRRPQDFSDVLFKPAPPVLLLAALRRRLQIKVPDGHL